MSLILSIIFLVFWFAFALYAYPFPINLHTCIVIFTHNTSQFCLSISDYFICFMLPRITHHTQWYHITYCRGGHIHECDHHNMFRNSIFSPNLINIFTVCVLLLFVHIYKWLACKIFLIVTWLTLSLIKLLHDLSHNHRPYYIYTLSWWLPKEDKTLFSLYTFKFFLLIFNLWGALLDFNPIIFTLLDLSLKSHIQERFINH